MLLLHGLSDSPYSHARDRREILAQGYYVLVLRLPGHGTVPAALIDVDWQDWAPPSSLPRKDARG